MAGEDREVVEGELERRTAEEHGLPGKRVEFREARLRAAETLGVRGGLERRRGKQRRGLFLAKAYGGECRGCEDCGEACFFHVDVLLVKRLAIL
jgi:ferredoxin